MTTVNICVTGSRVLGSDAPKIIRGTLTYYILSYLDKSFIVNAHIGDATGVDSLAENVLRLIVNNNKNITLTKHYVKEKNRRYSYALRSMEMVNETKKDSDISILFAYPNKVCPHIVTPANPFCGSGSGTWATIAYAKSLGLQVFLFDTEKTNQRDKLPRWLLQ